MPANQSSDSVDRPFRDEFDSDADYLTALARYGTANGYAAVYIDTEVVAHLAGLSGASEVGTDG